MIQTITNWFMTTISLMTAFGVFLHDGHLDKVVVSYDSPVDGAHIARSGHTHSDYNASNSLLNNSFSYQSPSIPPKNKSERKHRLDLPDTLRHAFDDELLPLVA